MRTDTPKNFAPAATEAKSKTYANQKLVNDVITDDTTLHIGRSKGGRFNTEVTSISVPWGSFKQKLSKAYAGVKDGPYLTRCCFKGNQRSDANAERINLIVLDCDKQLHIDEDGVISEVNGVCPPEQMHEALKELGITHLLTTSYSNAPPLHKYRVWIPALLNDGSELDKALVWIHTRLHEKKLLFVNVKENSSISQPWYTPRCPEEHLSAFKTLEYNSPTPFPMDDVIRWADANPDLFEAPTANSEGHKALSDRKDEIGLWLQAHNKSGEYLEVMTRNGFKLDYRQGRINNAPAYRLTDPASKSGQAGVRLYLSRWGAWIVYSHHSNGVLADGKAHDLLDLVALLEHGGNKATAMRALGVGKKTLPIQKGTFSLRNFSINDEVEEMEMKMLEEVYILGQVALLGQMTVFYASPNVGKTLITMKLLTAAIEEGKIQGSNVCYINADDNHTGLVAKTKLARKYGFNMIAPGYKGFRSQDVQEYLYKMIADDSCMGQIIILDTVKKFTDLMDKKSNTAFNCCLREFVAKGGSVIGLAHVNKHKNASGKSIAAGTSDMQDDFDCAYILECVGPDSNGKKIVTFENTKNRGGNIETVSYSYQRSSGMDYESLLNTIKITNQEYLEKASRDAQLISSLSANFEILEAIKDCICANVKLKTEIVNTVSKRTCNSNKKVKAVLEIHTGEEGQKGILFKQARFANSGIEYSLIPVVSDDSPFD